MNYYERHLGDYARDTGHLSMLEHGAYTALLDRYYATEKPIPVGQAYRVAKAGTKPERDAVDAVLTEFFHMHGDCWKHRRVDEEIAAVHEKSDKARNAAAMRWQYERNANASAEHGERISKTHPLQTPDTRHQTPEEKALVVGQAADPPKATDCPHDEIIATYHELLPVNPRVRQWDERRKTYLRSRWREAADRQSLDWWRKFFGYVAGSDFLTGKVNGDRAAFLPSLEWMIKPANFIKIIEGNYENR